MIEDDAQPRPGHLQQGLTLVELLVVLGLLAAMTFAIPGFLGFLEQQRLTADANEFMLAVAYARSEAVRRGDIVSVQATGIGRRQ